MIVYRTTVEDITPEQLRGFFVGWPAPPTPAVFLSILRNSAHRVLAIDDTSGQVVGFINAVSDGVLSAYIPLVEVLPEYQKQGIGEELVRRMVEELRDYYMVDLCCDEHLVPFYRRVGMTPVVGMVRRNYAMQSGRVSAADSEQST